MSWSEVNDVGMAMRHWAIISPLTVCQKEGHLLLDHSWPRVTETVESNIMDKERPLYLTSLNLFLHLYNGNTSTINRCYKVLPTCNGRWLVQCLPYSRCSVNSSCAKAGCQDSHYATDPQGRTTGHPVQRYYQYYLKATPSSEQKSQLYQNRAWSRPHIT